MNQITLTDKQHLVRFTWYTLAQIEQETNRKNILNDLDELGVHDSIVMAYYGLKCADKGFDKSLEDVGHAFVPGKTVVEVFEAFAKDMAAISDSEKK